MESWFVMSVGKRFEYQLRNAFREKYPDAFVERQTDRLYTAGASAESPPDLIINRDGANYLIECKAVKGRSIPFSRLGFGQKRYLCAYDAIGEYHHGFVACLFYNGQRGSGRVYRGWLVPIPYWVDYEYKYPRKSISMKDIERDLDDHELFWEHSAWHLQDWM
jgi:hypothetical protein